MDATRQVQRGSRFDKVCFLSRWFNLWILPLFSVGWRRTIVIQDVYGCSSENDPFRLGPRLEKQWQHELDLKKQNKIEETNVMKAVLRTFGWEWMIAMQPTIWIEMASRLLQPFMIEMIVRYLSQDEGTKSADTVTFAKVQIYAWILIVTTISFSMARHYAFLKCFALGLNVRIALTVLVFKKILRISKSSNKQTDAGQVLNVLANDLYRFDEVTKSTYGLIVGPVMSIIIMYVTYRNLGSAFLGGLVILITFVPFQGFMGRFFTLFRRKTTRITDKRVRLMSEILSAMKLIKVYCWEYPFADLVDQIRTTEINSIRKTFTLRGINSAVSYVCTKMMLFASLLIYTLMGHQLNPSLVFVTMSLYSSLNIPMLKNFSNAVGAGAEAFVAGRRVTDILMLDEKPEKALICDKNDQIQESNKGSVVFQNYYGKWSKSLPHDNLSNISLDVAPGELLIVIGSVGCGKTCFLWSMLKEIECVSGSCVVNGISSYAPQESWCFGATVKQNILVGRSCEQERYDKVITSCCLDKDLQRFNDYDESFVGEKGYTLSGGQKARVTLARAAYTRADVYLLDDPLSAVDPKVAELIFQRCIKELLGGKTVILVTHQLQFLDQADKILMLKDGQVCAFGTFHQLKDTSEEFVSFLNQKEDEKRKDSFLKERSLSAVSRSKSIVSSISSISSEYEAEDVEETKNQAVDRKEVQTSGSIPVHLFWQYLMSGRQAWLLILTVLISATSQALFHFADLWLAAWTGKNVASEQKGRSTVDESLVHEEEGYNITIYCILMGSLFIGAFLRSSLTFKLCLNSSISLHDRVFKQVLKAPMLFFENTPLGRIMNRFTKDIGTVDQDVPLNITEMNMNVIQVIGVIVMTVVVNYWLIIPCLILFGIAVFLRNYYIKTARDLQRLDSIARSPVYAQVSTTFDGLITIRAFNLEQRFEQQFMDHMFDSTSCRFLVLVANRMIGLIMDTLVAIYISVVVILCIYLPKGTITAGDAGAILSSSILLTGIFQYSLKLTTDFETQMISVERVFEYGSLESEAEWQVSKGIQHDAWPTKGEIIFDHVFLRYSPTLPHVLHDISFTVPGTKVGVVGRTGAGKSSLISVLFRLVEPEGRILIDGVDVRTLGLHELRGKISIIPQDPSLFSGTVRKNLDPFSQHADRLIWESLEEASLSPAIKKMDGQLDALISESGSNMSVGERQLLCLARALLNRNRILVLDEATANVDQETDSHIQKALKSKFKECTVITIAHRLNTVIDMDMILVLDQGRIMEYDHPYLLLQNESGYFSSMVKETGHHFAKGLHETARQSYSRKMSESPIDLKLD